MAFFHRASEKEHEDNRSDDTDDDMFTLLPSWNKDNTGAYNAIGVGKANNNQKFGESASPHNGSLPTFTPAPWTIAPKQETPSVPKPRISPMPGSPPSVSPASKSPISSPSSISSPSPISSAPTPSTRSASPTPTATLRSERRTEMAPSTLGVATIAASPATTAPSAVNMTLSTPSFEMNRDPEGQRFATGSGQTSSNPFLENTASASESQHAEPYFLEDDFDDDGDDDGYGSPEDNVSFYDANAERPRRLLGPILFVLLALACVGGVFYAMHQRDSGSTSKPDSRLESVKNTTTTAAPSESTTASTAAPSTTATPSTMPATTAVPKSSTSPSTTAAPIAVTPTTAAPSSKCTIYSDGTTDGCEGYDLSNEEVMIDVRTKNGKWIRCKFNDAACRAKAE